MSESPTPFQIAYTDLLLELKRWRDAGRPDYRQQVEKNESEVEIAEEQPTA